VSRLGTLGSGGNGRPGSLVSKVRGDTRNPTRRGSSAFPTAAHPAAAGQAGGGGGPAAEVASHHRPPTLKHFHTRKFTRSHSTEQKAWAGICLRQNWASKPATRSASCMSVTSLRRLSALVDCLLQVLSFGQTNGRSESQSRPRFTGFSSMQAGPSHHPFGRATPAAASARVLTSALHHALRDRATGVGGGFFPDRVCKALHACRC